LNVSDKLEDDVKWIAKILNTRKEAGGPATVLFLGSRTGSLFRLPVLTNLLKVFSNRDTVNMTPVEQFREWYQILEEFKKEDLDHDIHAIICKALQEKRIEVADICVAELMKQGIFDRIITTNIGSELERAFHQSGMEEPHDFQIIIPGPGEAVAGRMTKSHPFKIIKASGDVVSQRYSICGYNIHSKDLFLDKYPKLKTSVEQVKDEHMLMIGFDYKWDKHIMPTIFPRRAGSLWYINEEQTTEASPLFSDLQDCDAKRLEGPLGGYEPFFVNLYRHVLGFIPTYQTTPNQPTAMEKTLLNEMPNTQPNLQNDVSYLKTMLQSQETMVRDIKVDLKSLSEKVDTLLTQSTSTLLADSNMRNAKQSEES
jgi:hypothetical protein